MKGRKKKIYYPDFLAGTIENALMDFRMEKGKALLLIANSGDKKIEIVNCHELSLYLDEYIKKCI